MIAEIGCLLKAKAGNNYQTGIRAANLLVWKTNRTSLSKQYLFLVLIKNVDHHRTVCRPFGPRDHIAGYLTCKYAYSFMFLHTSPISLIFRQQWNKAFPFNFATNTSFSTDSSIFLQK